MEGLEWSKLVMPLWGAICSSIVIPIFTPVLRRIDSNHRRLNEKRKLENLKLSAELDNLFYAGHEDSKLEMYRTEYNRLVEQSCDFKHCFESKPGDKNRRRKSPFDIADVIAAILIPVAFIVLALIVVGGELTFPRDHFQMLIFLVATAGPSLAIAKWVICRFVWSGIWQGVLQLVTGLLVTILAITLLVMLDV